MSENTIHPDENRDKGDDPDHKGDSSRHTDDSSKTTGNEVTGQWTTAPDNAGRQATGADEGNKPAGGEHSDKITEPGSGTDSGRPVQEQTPVKQKPSSDSDNHISLIDRNNLQIIVSTTRGVRVHTLLKDLSTSEEIQSDEIYLPQRNDFGKQVAEIKISITEPEKSDGELPAQDEDEREGRFKPRLINENLQKVIFELFKGESVKIEYEFKDRKTSASVKRYKNYLSAKEEGRVYEVEITITVEDISETAADTAEGTESGRITLIPNPEVAELIQPPIPLADYSAGGYVDESGYKNPFDALRSLIRKNTAIGIAVAVALHLAAAGYAYYGISKKKKDAVVEEPQRLIVIQDLPDPKIRLENVEDPNKPPPEEAKDEVIAPPKRTVPPRKVVQPPKVNRPSDRESDKDTNDLTSLSSELDSLRRLSDSLLAFDTSGARDTSGALFDIPDSLRNNFTESDVGLGMYFPNNWKLIDEREINKNEKMFKGVLLTDTTAEQPGTLTVFIHLDRENKGFNTEEFTTEFLMLDTNLTAFSKQPETQAAHTKYEFYILNNIGTEKLSVKAEVRKEFFDKYKNEIEAVVRSINIKKKEDLEAPGNSEEEAGNPEGN